MQWLANPASAKAFFMSVLAQEVAERNRSKLGVHTIQRVLRVTTYVMGAWAVGEMLLTLRNDYHHRNVQP